MIRRFDFLFYLLCSRCLRSLRLIANSQSFPYSAQLVFAVRTLRSETLKTPCANFLHQLKKQTKDEIIFTQKKHATLELLHDDLLVNHRY